MSQRFNVTGVFNISIRGCVVHGEIQEGRFRIGDPIKILRDGVVVGRTTIAGIEMINYLNKSISGEDNIGLMLKGINKQDVLVGDIIMADDWS